MKQHLYIFFLLAGSAAMAQPADSRKAGVVVNPNAAEITFTETVHDFGTLKKGSPMTCRFTYKNTGKEPLILSDCKKGCHCTTVTCSKEPLQPGSTGFFEAHYDSMLVGKFAKELLIISNAKTPIVSVLVKGNVIDPESAEALPVKKDDNMKPATEKKPQ